MAAVRERRDWRNRTWLAIADAVICRVKHGRRCPHVGTLGTFWERARM
jgi:hypothetical protein